MEFTNSWRRVLNQIHSEVVLSFADFRSGSVILQAAMRQLLLYYRRFLDLVERRFGKSGRLPFKDEPVGVQNLMVEIKKLRINI